MDDPQRAFCAELWLLRSLSGYCLTGAIALGDQIGELHEVADLPQA